MSFHRFVIAAVIALCSGAASAATLNEVDFGEFGDRFDALTDFTGYSSVIGAGRGMDHEYFRFDSFQPGTTGLAFTLQNAQSRANMQIRLSRTPFTMPEWDWRIEELDAGNGAARQLYADKWAPEDRYVFDLPEGFAGPLYGLVLFHGAGAGLAFSINAVGAPDFVAPAQGGVTPPERAVSAPPRSGLRRGRG